MRYKGLLSLALVLCVVGVLSSGGAARAFALEDGDPEVVLSVQEAGAYTATYVDSEWDGFAVGRKTETRSDCRDIRQVVDRIGATVGSAGNETWYVASEDVSISNRLTVAGEVHLILADGVTLTCNDGIRVSQDSCLHVGQTNETDLVAEW